jgi:hypothetical protein
MACSPLGHQRSYRVNLLGLDNLVCLRRLGIKRISDTTLERWSSECRKIT